MRFSPGQGGRLPRCLRLPSPLSSLAPITGHRVWRNDGRHRGRRRIARRILGAGRRSGRGQVVEVLDQWDRLGDWTQQWLNLRYIVRLLARVGAHEEARDLHRYLVAAGKPSPLDEPERRADGSPADPALSGADAVDLARRSLHRLV